MGKIYRILVVFSFLVFGACDQSEDKSHYVIGFSQAMTTDSWRLEMNRSMKIEASLDSDIKLQIKDAEDDIELQIEHINSFVKEGVDVLIVSPIQSEPLTATINHAMSAGIPTIIIDRTIEGRNYTAYVGANNVEMGENAAKYIMAHSDGSGNIVEIKGLEGSSPAFDRALGFREALESQTELEIVGTVEGNWEKPSVVEGLNRVFDSIEKVDYIFAHNDRMAESAFEVAKQRGLAEGITFIGVDGLFGPNNGIQMVKDKILSATILYPTGGSEAIKLSRKLLQNELVEKNNILRTVVIDSVNVDLMQNQFNKLNQQQTDIEQQQITLDEQINRYQTQNHLIKLLAFFSFLLMVLAVYSIYLAVKNQRSKAKLVRKNEKIEQQRNQIEGFMEQLKVKNENKINFFTALSHEFKTPLTLITSSVETMVKSKDQNINNFENETGLIMNNSRRLLGLINELLDFRKLENDSFQVRPVKTNLYQFISIIISDFRSEALKQSIQLEFRCSNKELELYFDRSLLDKALFNLLSNAFKFTPRNGKISIRLEDRSDNDKVDIYISDSGLGIPEKEQELIFNPFFQASNNVVSGSGMGLFLTRKFIEFNKGSISVRSNKGTHFHIWLRKGKKHFKDIPIMSPVPLNAIQTTTPSIDKSSTVLQDSPEMDHEMSVLVIEDNLELAGLLQKNLRNDYNVFHSEGADGIEKTLEIVPDIILCDLNLPDINGFEICRELKNDLRTSHIPIVILTALDDEESRIKALKAGADFYLTKPFRLGELQQAVLTMLFNREKLRYYYTNRINLVEDEKLNSLEQQFLAKTNMIIEENFRDPKFSVEMLSEKLSISRVQLYRKVKALLGVSVNELINSQRMNKGRDLLKDTPMTISEIAYTVGYSSPGYFSTSFKGKFGITPKKFRESIPNVSSED